MPDARRPKTVRAAKEFHPGRLDRLGNAVVSMLARLGLGPFHLLTTRGRKTGRLHSNPVTLVEHDGKTWLVAPYGAVSWVLNTRAAGQITIRRGRNSRELAIREAGPEEAAPILKRYVGIARVTRPYFQANKDSPPEDFIAEAHRHPVFELTPL